jgi:MFS family permease
LSTARDDDEQPANFYWLVPGLRPPVVLKKRQERIFLLVGMAALFAGYDLNVFGLALPQIQASLHIPENQTGITVAIFRLAAFFALALATSADIVGRRRLLLITIFGQALATLATAFVLDANQFIVAQFITRVFGYAEEILCVVVIVEEMDEHSRGWATGTFGALDSTGAGLASLVFAFVTMLPYGWRAIYVIGALPMLLLAYLRRRLPETQRFEVRKDQVVRLQSRAAAALDMARRIAREYPGRIALILLAVGAYGFSIGASTVLMGKYLQQTLHYAPWQVTALYIPGGFAALALNIVAGRLSDRWGRKPVLSATVLIMAASFAVFYSGVGGIIVPVVWIIALFAFFSTDALLSGYAIELVPTAYRATMSGLRYLVAILAGAASLALEGVFYDWLGGHGPAISLSLAAAPLVLVAVYFLPEPAGKTLEEMSGVA